VLGRWNLYACSIEHAKLYVEAVEAGRGKNQTKTVEETIQEIQEEGVIELQAYRMQQYAKQNEAEEPEITEESEVVEEFEIIEKAPKVSHSRRRKTLDNK